MLTKYPNDKYDYILEILEMIVVWSKLPMSRTNPSQIWNIISLYIEIAAREEYESHLSVILCMLLYPVPALHDTNK